jgi:hypothetical protein
VWQVITAGRNTSHTHTQLSQTAQSPSAMSSPAASAKATHPEWHGPHGVSDIHVRNSLTSTLVPFIPAHGKYVGWYTCGPTVYDSAHLGHARWSVTPRERKIESLQLLQAHPLRVSFSFFVAT